jgi:hypothetical protein
MLGLGAFLRIALFGVVAACVLSVILCWNEYFFAALLTSTNAKTLPVMVASQTGSQGINWWFDRRALDRRDCAAGHSCRVPGALHREGSDGGCHQTRAGGEVQARYDGRDALIDPRNLASS